MADSKKDGDDEVGNVRPSRLSMEGYIYNANRVLEACLSPDTKEVPVELIQDCKGVAIMTLVCVGALVTLQYGTGVILKKTDNGWSPPSAASLGGSSVGAVLGGKRDNIIIFIMDDEHMEDFAVRPQSRMALDASVAAGKGGAKGNLGQEAEKKGTITFTLSEGAFAGLGVQMFTLESASAQNEIFYDKAKVKTKDILFKQGAVKVPEDSQVPDLYDKMKKLALGETWIPGEEDIERSKSFHEIAKRQSFKYVSGELGVSAAQLSETANK